MAIDDPYEDETGLPEDEEPEWPGEPDGNSFEGDEIEELPPEVDPGDASLWDGANGSDASGEACNPTDAMPPDDAFGASGFQDGLTADEGAGWTDAAEDGGAWDAAEDGGAWDEGVDWPSVDEDAFIGRAAWPDATDQDFEEDTGEWSSDTYDANARTLFGWREEFGRSAEDTYLTEGYTPWRDEGFGEELHQHFGPGISSIRMYEKDGAVVPRGFLDLGTLASIAALYPALDLSRVHVTMPGRTAAPAAEPRPLPDAFRAIQPADGVDLRRYCLPVGDQGQTSRCAAFAWTHAVEMLAAIQNTPVPPLSCSFTMFRFQQRQGDARGFEWAWKGGEGTQGTWEPGQHLMEWGTCRKELWPDDQKTPTGAPDVLESDARAYTFEADTYDITVDDMKKMLTAGFPVQISIATGEAFQDIGPDGVMKVAEKPSGQHGYHAMLCVGYVGNFFIVKNSWGDSWGDRGYCYIPKKVLLDAEPEPVAMVPRKPGSAGGAAGAPPARTAPVRCGFCGSMVPPGPTCPRCKGPLRQEHRCKGCQAFLPPGRVACPSCGAVHG